MSEYSNLIEMQEDACRKFSDRPMYGTRDANGQFQWLSYGEFAKQVDQARGGLAQLGLGAGDKAACIARNCTEWAVAAYGTYGRRGHFTGMYEDQALKDWHFIIEDSGAKVVFVYNAEIEAKVRPLIDQIETLEHVINITGDESDANSFAALLKSGAENPVDSEEPGGDEPMGLIYTSGTTGKPKGVILSHTNIISNVNAIGVLMDFTPEDRSLCFLPWAHIFGQLGEVHGMISNGCSAAFVENVAKIVDDLAEVKPTVLYSVPRVFNKIYEGVNAQIAAKGGLAQTLLTKGMAAATRKNAGESLGLIDGLILSLADSIVFSKVRERFGGRLKYAMSGAAALNKDVAQFMSNLGVTVYEGYGLSETSPMVSVNSKLGAKIGTVGKVVPGVEVKLDKSVVGEDSADGEIVVYGPNVMMGYHNRPDATAEVMTDDGGFKTGDLGRFDDEGYLMITGRIKEQYKLENGKYVVPAPVEEKLQISALIDQVLLYGDNRLYNIALIVPNLDALSKAATEKGSTATGAELLNDPVAKELIQAELDTQKANIKGYEMPKKFALLAEPWTVENGLMTPTMKLKRTVVVDQLKDQIEALYG